MLTHLTSATLTHHTGKILGQHKHEGQYQQIFLCIPNIFIVRWGQIFSAAANQHFAWSRLSDQSDNMVMFRQRDSSMKGVNDQKIRAKC